MLATNGGATSERSEDIVFVPEEEAPKVVAEPEPKKVDVKEVEEIDSDIEFVSAPTFTVDMRDELKDEEGKLGRAT
eukprot:symbB.v1.2.016323.t1/scaffold1240.1/size129799/6